LSLAVLGLALSRQSPLAERIWKQVAFLGRYGHQPVDVTLSMPVVDMHRLLEAVGQLIEEEGEAMRRAAES
jgi:hypothetical protein